MTYQVKLPVFEGPLEALFHLIQKAEVDVYEVSMAKIADDYLDYLTELKEFNLEIAGEFIVMAATLLRIKSSSLLPAVVSQQVGETDILFSDITTQEDLIARIADYRQFQKAAQTLKDCEESRKKIFLRHGEDKKNINAGAEDEYFCDPESVSLSYLFEALQSVLKDLDVQVGEIEPEQYSVKDIMLEITLKVQQAGYQGLAFTDLFSYTDSKVKVVLVFFTLLEMLKRKQIKAWQEQSFAMIYIQDCQEG